MRAKEFAGVASRLSQIPVAGPADFRTSISRAYYAAYHVAVEALTQIGAVPHAGPGGHSEVANLLIASGDDVVRDAGRAISDLHTRRIHADYRMVRTDVETRTSAQSHVKSLMISSASSRLFVRIRPGAKWRRAILMPARELAAAEISLLPT